MAKLGFGKHKDLELRDVPEDYLNWLISNSRDKIKLYEDELQRRLVAETANASYLEKIIKAGYRTMAKQCHPDAGGSSRDMIELLAAYDKLKDYLRQNDPNQIFGST